MRRVVLPLALALMACEMFELDSGLDVVVAQPAAPSKGMRPSHELAGHMHGHVKPAVGVRDAVIAGDLDEVRRHAAELAAHEPSPLLPAQGQPFLTSMRSEANALAKAKDLPTAAAATGRLTLACGNCHAALKATPRFPIAPKPTSSKALADQMAVHGWGAARLWEGVVGPADQTWKQGATALKMAPLCAEGQAAELDVPGDGLALQQRVNALTSTAPDKRTLPERSRLLGELLAVCADCHTSGC